jgi:hypothetical protein
MCVSNRIEQFSASYFLAGLSPPVPLVILLAQVAHEQDEDDDGPGGGDSRPGNGARHIGHAADVEEDANDDADNDRHRCQSSNCVSLVSHSSHLLSGRNGLKAKGDFSPFW